MARATAARRAADPVQASRKPPARAHKPRPGAGRPPPVAIAREPIFEAIVKRLREDILRGVYPAQTPLRLQELADRFGTSLMPVREALHRLTAEGLLISHPRRGATVAEFDAAEALEISDLRRVLMGHASRLAVPLLTPQDLRELEQITRSIDAMLREQPLRFDRYLELNDRFHGLLCERSGNRHLVRLVRSFDVLSRMAMYRFHQSATELLGFNDQHRQILAAAQQRDAERVEKLIGEHFARTAQRIRSTGAPLP